MIKAIFTQILMRPIFNILIIFLAIFNWNLWIAIILLTLLVRLCMIKITSANQQMQHGMNDLQPKLDEIQKKYKDDPNRLAQETMNVFKKDWKWPLKWCLGMLIQLPIFMWLYYTVINITKWTEQANLLYSFFYDIWSKFASGSAIGDWSINNMFLWMDMFATKNIILTIITTVLTIVQMKLTNLVKPATPAPQKWPNWQPMPDMSKMMWMMTWFMAFMMWSVVYATQWAIWLYLATTTLFSVVQYTIQYRKFIYAERLKFRNKPQIINKK